MENKCPRCGKDKQSDQIICNSCYTFLKLRYTNKELDNICVVCEKPEVHIICDDCHFKTNQTEEQSEADMVNNVEVEKMSEEKKCVLCDEIKYGVARFCEYHLEEWADNDLYSTKETDIYVEDYKNGTLRKPKEQPETDMVNHPPHYTSHPSGIECIDVVRHMNYCLGNAIKYIWRAGLKGDKIEDLKKAKQYIDFEIERIENEKK